jgi:hypothetical protein
MQRPICSGEVRLNELWTGVDVDLAQDGLSGVNKAVRSVGRDDDNAAGFHFTGLIADRDRGTAFKRERDFNVWMCVQWRTLPGFCINDIGRERRALFFSDKLIRHSDKRKLLEIQKRHGKTDAPPAARDKTKVFSCASRGERLCELTTSLDRQPKGCITAADGCSL